MAITLISTPAPANAAASLPTAAGTQGTATEGLPGDFSQMFSQLVDRFNAFAAEGQDKAKGDALRSKLAAKAQDAKAAELPSAKAAPLPTQSDDKLIKLSADATVAAQTTPLASEIKRKASTGEDDKATPSDNAFAALASLFAPAPTAAPTTTAAPAESAVGDALSGASKANPKLEALLPQGAKPNTQGQDAAQPHFSLLTPGGEQSGNPAAQGAAIIAASQDATTTLTPMAEQGASPQALNAAAQQSLAPVAKHAEAPATQTISTPVKDAGWSQELGEKVVWMSKNTQQQAQINLNPPNLGPLQITLNLNSDQATAQFFSPHADVRQAIQDAMPQLKEMLASSGISLGQTSVGSEPSRQQADNPRQGQEASRFSTDRAILDGDHATVVTTETPVPRRGRGMVDLFA